MPPDPPPKARRRPPRRAAPPVHVEYHLLLLLTLGLVAFGLIMVYSASSGVAVVQGHDPLGPLVRQGSYALAGVACMAGAARLSYRRLRIAGPFLMLAALIGLILVKVPGIGIMTADRLKSQAIAIWEGVAPWRFAIRAIVPVRSADPNRSRA